MRTVAIHIPASSLPLLLTFSGPPLHPLSRNVAPNAQIARLHGAVQECTLQRQSVMVHFHDERGIFAIRSSCELGFPVLYVIYLKYGITETKPKQVTKICLYAIKTFRNFIRNVQQNEILKSVNKHIFVTRLGLVAVIPYFK